jgi:hypothetical protein
MPRHFAISTDVGAIAARLAEVEMSVAVAAVGREARTTHMSIENRARQRTLSEVVREPRGRQK